MKYHLPNEWIKTNDSNDSEMIGNSDGSNLDQMIVIKSEQKKMIKFGSNKKIRFGLRISRKV